MTIKLQCPPRGAAIQGDESKALEAELANLNKDEAVVVRTHAQRQMAYKLAFKLGFQVITRKIQGKGFGIWRADLLHTKLKTLSV